MGEILGELVAGALLTRQTVGESSKRDAEVPDLRWSGRLDGCGRLRRSERTRDRCKAPQGAREPPCEEKAEGDGQQARDGGRDEMYAKGSS